MAQGADLGLQRRRGLTGGEKGADHGAVVPVAGLGDQRDGARAAATEEDRVDLHAAPVVEFVGRGRALGDGHAVTGVRVSGRGSGLRRPVVALPVDEVLRRLAVHALPPDIAVIGERDIGEQGVARLHRTHGVRVGGVVGARGNAEEAVFGVDGVEAIVGKLEPCDVVADDLGLPTRDGRGDHGQVGLAAGGRERAGDVVGLAVGVDELEDEHVLSHPALFLRHDGSDAQGVALLRQDGVAAVAGTVGPDLLGLRELGDVLGVIARPRDVFLALLERSADGVKAVHEVAVLADLVQSFLTHAGHDPHGHDHVSGVSELHAQLRVRVGDRAHAERHNVHRAALHGAAEVLGHLGLELVRGDPIIGGAGAVGGLRRDEGAGLHTRHVGRVGAGEEAVRTLFLVELDQRALLHELGSETVPFLLGTVSENHLIWLKQFDCFVDPLDQLLVLGGRLARKPLHCSGHSYSSILRRFLYSAYRSTPVSRPNLLTSHLSALKLRRSYPQKSVGSPPLFMRVPAIKLPLLAHARARAGVV